MIRLVALLMFCGSVLHAQGAQHVVIVTGLSGDAAIAKRFAAAATMIRDSALTRWRVGDSNVVWLAEAATVNAPGVNGRATREALHQALAVIARTAASGDRLLLILIGHGSGDGGASKVSLAGPDPTAADLALWLEAFAGQQVAIVIAASGSGDFLPILSRPGRVVITATKSATERNESWFAGFIASGLTSDSADADKNGVVTLHESFAFARAGVARQYAARNVMLSEHAQLDDNGDGKASPDSIPAASGDGSVARMWTLGPKRTNADPRVAALIAERAALEQSVVALRSSKATTDPVIYERELERLLLEIATRTQEIRRVVPDVKP